jgi:hypothetical protein
MIIHTENSSYVVKAVGGWFEGQKIAVYKESNWYAEGPVFNFHYLEVQVGVPARFGDTITSKVTKIEEDDK